MSVIYRECFFVGGAYVGPADASVMRGQMFVETHRLVARTLERSWEEALAAQAQLAGEYEQDRRQRAATPSPAEAAAIRTLAQDVPALWNAATTTQAERQTIARLLLERVLVEVVDATEQLRVECHWQGGHRTQHQLSRPVARLKALSTYPELVHRAGELRQAGHGFGAIADMLNAEGWRPAKRRDTFNAQMVHHLLTRAGVIAPKYRRRAREIERATNEWTIRELAAQIGMPEPTLYNWVQQGRLRSRVVQTSVGRAKLVHADAETIIALKAIRGTPAPWHRRPPPLTPADSHTTDS